VTALARQDNTSNAGKIKQVSFQEMSSEEKKELIKQARNMTVEFLKKNAPEYENDKQVLVVTTAGAIEWESNGGKVEDFYGRLSTIPANGLTNMGAIKINEKAPDFVNSIK
jgi:hypothetical protein